MKTNFILSYLILFLSVSQISKSQINIKVSVKSISVLTTLDCDAGGSDNSDFVFEYKALDNSALAFSNNTPVAGSIGMCNYAVVNEQNGPYNFTPITPGSAVFSPTTGVFFDRSYNCKNEIPTSLTLTWRAYENDDASAPSTTPIADGVIATQINTFTVPTANGTYTTQYTQTSSDGACPQTYVLEFYIQKTVGSFLPLTLLSVEANIICTGSSNGHLESLAAGGSGTVLFDWSHDGLGDYDDNAVENGLMAGTYTLVVKDALNCTDTSSVTIFSENPPSTIGLFTTSSSSVCTGQSAVSYAVNTQSNVVFYWNFDGPGTIMNGGGNAITLDFLSFAGSGVLSVYAQNSCSISPTVSMAITVQQSPNITVSGSTSMCNNTQEILTASGATSYSWSTGANTASVSVTPSVTTIYTINATGVGGCMSAIEYTMNVQPTPTLQVNGSTLAVCPNQTVAVTSTGNGNLFIWSDGFFGANHTVQATTTTIYTITNTYTNSCYTQVTYTLNVNPGPVLVITGNTIVCEGGIIALTANGANSYAWSDGVMTNTNTFVPTTSTSLTLVGTALNGCKDSIVKAIHVVVTPTVTISGGDTICEGQFVTLTATANGTVTYGWNSGANTASISVSPNGTFTYNVVADNGACTGSASHEVFVKLIPTIDFTISSPPLCTIDPLYTFTANPSGGTYTGTGVTADTFDPSVGVGTYPITYAVTVSNGCLTSQTQTIDVMICAGVNEADNSNELVIFPNPTSSYVTLKSNKAIASIMVYDYSGKLVRLIETSALNTTIDMSALSKGFYSFTIMMSDRSQRTMKVVKD